MKQTEILTPTTHVNGWEPAVHMSCRSQNFRLFHVSNLSVRNFRIFLLMYTGSMTVAVSGEMSPGKKSRQKMVCDGVVCLAGNGIANCHLYINISTRKARWNGSPGQFLPAKFSPGHLTVITKFAKVLSETVASLDCQFLIVMAW